MILNDCVIKENRAEQVHPVHGLCFDCKTVVHGE